MNYRANQCTAIYPLSALIGYPESIYYVFHDNCIHNINMLPIILNLLVVAAMASGNTKANKPVPLPIPATVTLTTSYTPVQTDFPGAVATEVFTTTVFGPAQSESAGVEGGTILFGVVGDISNSVSTGLWLAMATRLSGTTYESFRLFDTQYSSAIGETIIGVVVTDIESFQEIKASVNSAPSLWLAIGLNCATFISPDGNIEIFCTQCSKGQYSVAGTASCLPCTPLASCPGTVACTNAVDSVCESKYHLF